MNQSIKLNTSYFWSFIFILCSLFNEVCVVSFVSPGPSHISWFGQPLAHESHRSETPSPSPVKRGQGALDSRPPALRNKESKEIKQGCAWMCQTEVTQNRNYNEASTISKMRISQKKYWKSAMNTYIPREKVAKQSAQSQLVFTAACDVVTGSRKKEFLQETRTENIGVKNRSDPAERTNMRVHQRQHRLRILSISETDASVTGARGRGSGNRSPCGARGAVRGARPRGGTEAHTWSPSPEILGQLSGGNDHL